VKDKINNILLGLVIPILLLIGWIVMTSQSEGSSQLLTPPGQVIDTLLTLIKDGEISKNLMISFYRVMLGFLSGAGAGLISGILMGISSRAEELFSPVLNGIKQVPLFAWMPLIILLCGIGEASKIIFIALGALYPMMTNTFEGIRNVPRHYIEVATVFEYTKVRTLRKVILPSALPSILAGTRMSLSLSWLLVVASELLGSESGIGFMIVWARQMFQLDVVIAGVLVVGLTGFLMNFTISALEKRLLRWRNAFNAK